LDIRLIRDQRTLKSKGLAYVEFWETSSVQKAISLNGYELGGYPISIQITQSEQETSTELPDIPMRLYVGNLHPKVGEEDLRPLFEPFGDLASITLAREPSGESKGFAHITFKKETEAKTAVETLNDLDLAGQPMKVGVVDMAQTSFVDPNAGGGGAELDDSGGLNMTAQGRQALMAKLARDANMPSLPTMPQAPQQSQLNVPLIQPTTCLVVKNMFNPAEETDAEFHLDIAEDIRDECMKSNIKPTHLFVDREHPQGHVFMRFSDIPSCQKIASTFHGRWFAQRQIIAAFVPEATYNSRFPQ
jgi:RNA-binding protein 39